ncbi:hypothetical protein [Sporichthya sp.]|uniref:hypothetical protein n=1 Tax=Sporichthya sp. TaxID=65475 RepID=UPI00180A243C|nr:hypothetical protein [Sporichthya sp.]MBA3742340.1 hypothetical protein [Sporichthya sp.]
MSTLFRRKYAAMAAVPVLIGSAVFGLQGTSANASDEVKVFTSNFTSTTGEIFTATNHLVQDSPEVARAKRALVKSAFDGTNPDAKKIVTADGKIRHEWIVAWAGDWNAADNNTASLVKTKPIVSFDGEELRDNAVGPDFLAVIDATKGSPTYGKVVNTVTTGPVVENEPHHMQYLWHKGDEIFAGGLYSDITYVFDVKALPNVTIKGVNLPTDTPCGSIPDAYWTLKDGTAYGTYMGGADVPGPCTYTNGEVRLSNGFGGSPGSLVHIGRDGKTLSEVPAALPDSEDPNVCLNIPAIPTATCANPHGIQAREDLNILIASDYAEPRNIVLDPVKAPDARIFRPTVRTWDITERDNAKLRSVSIMPDGPRKERVAAHEEPRGIMEVTVTNQKEHKGAFASSMCGGVIYYTPDITAAKPKWREVFDDTTAARIHNPQVNEGGGCDGGGWVQTSPDDKYLYHAVIGRNPGSIDPADSGVAKQVYMLDIRKLLAAGTNTTCSIDTIQEVSKGGAEKDCPTLTDSFLVQDNTSGGPHWGTPDNFTIGKDGYYHETTNVTRLAFSNYFVARTNNDGNHQLCILNISKQGKLSLDDTFIDENTGASCVNFNRTSWPHGDYGDAKPHSMLFVVADEDVR